MMASLPQTPAQTGLASILAALGQTAPAGNASGEPGFEQLLANLPATAATGTATQAIPVAANLFGAQTSEQAASPADVQAAAGVQGSTAVTTPPAAALFGLATSVAEVPVDAAPIAKAPAKPGVTQPTDEAAAAAATLLIATATPLKNVTPATDKTVPVAHESVDEPTDDAPETPATATPVTVAVESAAVAEAPATAAVVAAAMPTADKPVAEKAAKPAAPTMPHRPVESAPQPLAPARTNDATPSQPTVPAPAGPTTAKPVSDAGASMTIVFAQPDLQGAAPLTEAAKPAPVAERVLDMGSDDQWIAQLAADIAATKSDKGDISFRLMPRHLGRLDVSMLTGDAGVTLKLDTQHEATATIVQAAQPRLVEDLRQQGVRVADAQVTHTPAETGRQQQQGQSRHAAPDASHLIETAPERSGADSEDRVADRRGRFA